MAATDTLYVAARAVDYLGIALFAGGLFFVATLWPVGGDSRGARAVVTSGWLLGLVGTIAALGLQAAWIAGGPPSAMFDAELVGSLLDVQTGRIWFAKALLWLLAGVVLASLLNGGERAARSVAWRVGAGAVALGLVRAAGLTGHAADGDTPLTGQLAALVHLAGVSLWGGGLAVLLFGVLSRRQPDELAAVVPRYSRLAMTSVLLVVAAGVVLAWQSLGSADRLTTSYGQTLLVKLALVAAVLLVAYSSRSWVGARLDFAVVLRGPVAVVRPFVYSVAAETVLVVGVLAAASFLVTADPGR